MASPTIIGTPAQGRTNGTSHTQSVTVPGTGSNRALFVITWQGGGGTTPSSVTYNAGAMTQVVSLSAAQQINGNMYFLANPTVTTANVVATYAGTNTDTFALAFVLQDCAQSSPVDVSGQNSSAGATSLQKAVTTTTDNTFVVTWMACNPGGTNLTPDTGQTDIAADLAYTNVNAAHSWEEQTTAGSYTGGYSWTGSVGEDLYVAAIKYLAPSATRAPLRSLMGVGL